jgi:hypothetical protein
MSSGCVRQAWLTLGTLTMPLEGAGYFCTELDLGYPVVREVMSNKPDMNGADDRTLFLGARTVTANLTAVAGAGARIDAVATSFSPFMVPSARPVLHYVLDRPGTPERTMNLRPSGYSWPVIGPYQRDIQLQWVCSDPDAKDPNTHTVTAWAGSSVRPGRVYNRTYPLRYPVGGNTPTTGLITPAGDLPVRPRLLIYGPITAPVVTVSPAGAGQPLWSRVTFQPWFTVGAGHYVEVDCYNKTARLDGDPLQPATTALDWQNSTWPVINPVPPAAFGCYLQLAGSSTSVVTQVQAVWNDRYLL